MKFLRSKLSVLLVRKPGKVVLFTIFLLNILLVLVSAVVLYAMPLEGKEQMSFWSAVYYTLTMMFDAGCVETVMEQMGGFRIGVSIFCISVTLLGMVLFTGAVVGYLTNVISKFIDRADDGSRKLILSGHIVVLGWNSRAYEIANETLYLETKQTMVFLVGEDRERIQRELEEHLQASVDAENAEVWAASKNFPWLKRKWYRRRNKFKSRLTVIVREGDVFSTKQLNDISIKHAKTIIILGGDIGTSEACKYDLKQRKETIERGNPQSVKALIQVAELTGAEDSDNRQKIVIEVEDTWTQQLVDKIIEHKTVAGKCSITSVSVNKILGQILSQISIMPELNLAYRELFSNKGMTFYAKERGDCKTEQEFFDRYLSNNNTVIPLAYLSESGDCIEYFAAEREKDIDATAEVKESDYTVDINEDYWIEQKNVVILGHNSKISDLMAGFASFCDEWNNEAGNILQIVVIDEKSHLEKMNYYREYPSVIKTVEADIYDREIICSEIEEFVDSNPTDTSILILSDDTEPRERIDSNAITYLLYVRDIIQKKRKAALNFREDSIDVIIEILNPKHYDIVKSYNADNIVISNRYISKMITQIGEKEELFQFFEDILSYDEAGAESYQSKEIYAKKVSRYFRTIPETCTASEFVRAVYKATSGGGPGSKSDNAVALGYVDEAGKVHFFTGNRDKMTLTLTGNCKVILFSNH